jgi:putative nucleotidyltransferase with HDIG domain
MYTKVLTTQLRVGMFVSDLDRPWVDTPFLLQGFLIEDERQIRTLRKHCEYVIVDRARSVGEEFAPEPAVDPKAPPRQPSPPRQPLAPARSAVNPVGASAIDAPMRPQATPVSPRRAVRLEEAIVAAQSADGGMDSQAEVAEGGGAFGRFIGLFRGKTRRPIPPPPVKAEPLRESKEEFEARTAFVPQGIAPQNYVDQVSLEQEVPQARAAVGQASDLLGKLLEDVRVGHKFEVERVEEIVLDMVESIVRNPDALMWLARLREEDSTIYGHGLEVSVYLTSFGRHLGFPKPQLAKLAQIGLLLDIGKTLLPKSILEKQGKLTEPEFDIVKRHVNLGIEILKETSNFDPQVLDAIAQHHERLNGTGYPRGLEGDEISIYGRMAGIADCFAAMTTRRPYAEAASSYDALRTLASWGGELFQENLLQQFVSSVGVFPVGSLIELSSGEVAFVVAHNKVRRLKPRVLIVTGPDKTHLPHPKMVDLLYDPKLGGDEPAFIKRGVPAGAYGLDVRDFYLA